MSNHIAAIKIGGASGQGVKTSGYVLTKALKNLGYWTFTYSEYPSLIKGGHSTIQINVSYEKIHSATHAIDILIAFNAETVEKHYQEINKNGFVIVAEGISVAPKTASYLKKLKVTTLQIPVKKILEKNEAKPVMANSVLTGACWALMTGHSRYIQDQIAAIFKQKKKDTETNKRCTADGFAYVKEQAPETFDLQELETEKRIIGTGNEVAGLSIYAAGCRVYCAYPMTPSTGILHFLAARAEKTGMVVKQAEDEMTAILSTIGANFAGTRACCATSGGGIALMTESLSLAGMTETPLVVINSQRPGPATGIPTWTEQGDLGFMTKIGHGEFPRIILSPGDADEVFQLLPQAFNLAEKFQTLVIVLLDKYISESWYQTNPFDDTKIKVNRGQLLSAQDLAKVKKFKRYKLTVSGVSPRPIPGIKNGIYAANSDEHDEIGYSTEDLQMRKEMMDKRMRKMTGITSEIPEPTLYGPKNAKTTLIAWGSQKGPILDAIKILNKKENRVNMLHYSIVYPLKGEQLKKLSKRNKLIAVENNYSGQLADLIREQTGIAIETRITKYVGTPFFRDELVEILTKKI